MLAITTNGIGQMDFSSTSKSKSKQKDEQVNDAFASLMNMGAISNNPEQNEIIKEDNINDISSVENVEVSVDTYKKNNELTGGESMVVLDEDEPMSEGIVDYGNMMLNISAEEVNDVLSDLVADIKQILLEELGISEEQLNEIVSQLDMTSVDFLDDEFVKKIILMSENSTEVDILIDEELSVLIENIDLKVENAIINHDAVSYAELVRQAPDFKEQLIEVVKDFEGKQELIINKNDSSSKDISFEFQKSVIKRENEFLDGDDGYDAIAKADKEIIFASEAKAGTDENNTNNNGNFERLVFEMDKAINNTTLEGINSFSEHDGVQQADIVRQIIDSIKVNLSKETTSLEVQLNPENLGKVQITVASKNGVMHAQILAENELAKNAIENNIAMLRDSFNNQELKVDAIEVMVSTYGFLDEYNQGDDGEQEEKSYLRQSKSINLKEGINIDDLDDEEQLTVEIMKASGNSLNYLI